jgi:predicted flap endonuclease-1-like 5' DNA nuclease
MVSHREQNVRLPGWLWFFLILPLGLLVALLYRPKKAQQFARHLGISPERFSPVRLYKEPDSIPLEIRPEIRPTAGQAVSRAVPPAQEEASVAKTTVRLPKAVAPVAPDDLTVIEGIGPKIASLLREAGILTLAQLAGAPLERLDEILSNARLRHLAHPETWPEQARLAAAGDWDSLLRLQKTLKGGRRSGAA